jgi:hypothetical protein
VAVCRAYYSARIGESYLVAEHVSYDSLLKAIVAFTIRAAVARSIDEYDWEQDQLHLHGVAALQFFRDGKGIWTDRDGFAAQLAEAKSQGDESRFADGNELDAYFPLRFEADLRDRWRLAGYDVPSLMCNMKKLFAELERDARDRASEAWDRLVDEIVDRLFTDTTG